MPTPTQIVILGGGFAGVYTAYHLEKLLRKNAEFQITLINRQNYFLLTPLLFEAGSGILEPRHAVCPIRPLFHSTRFIEAQVDHVDTAAKSVHARHDPGGHPYEIKYDQLVLALGGITNRAIIPGSEHALAFKTLADAIFLRNHAIDIFEQAQIEPDPQRRRELLTFVIVGAGLVGVELAGELTEFLKNICRSYRNISYAELAIHLLEAGPNVLPEMRRDLADYAVKVLAGRRVQIHASAPVEKIEPRTVRLKTGPAINARTIILAAGVAPNPLLEQFQLPKIKGRIAVQPTMRSAEKPEIWALGDCAAIPDPTGKPYPMLAQHALREARLLAHNILAAHRQLPLQPFVYEALGTLASLGHYSGVGRVMKIKVKGFIAWWVWRTYYVMRMPRFNRRLRIIVDWTVALFFRNDIVKLDLFGAVHPLQSAQQRAAQTEK